MYPGWQQCRFSLMASIPCAMAAEKAGFLMALRQELTFFQSAPSQEVIN